VKKEEIFRKSLDNQKFFELRQRTEKIASFLGKRITSHMEVLKPLFLPRKLLGTFVKSASMEDVPKADKAFADIQEQYAAVCEKPFGLSKKLQLPLLPISIYLEAVPYTYPIAIESTESKTINIISPTRWILSYRNMLSLDRLKVMVFGKENRQLDEMKQTIINHIALIVFLKYFPALHQLLEDLRYKVEIIELAELGNLPVVMLRAPLETFLPPDDFILQVTQLSGVDAFQEIIDLEAVGNMEDYLKNDLKELIS
jgi:hypothetical protein